MRLSQVGKPHQPFIEEYSIKYSPFSFAGGEKETGGQCKDIPIEYLWVSG